MNHKWNQGKLVSGEFSSNGSDVIIAEFGNEFNNQYQRRLVNTLNYGDEMIKIYHEYRNNMHISNIHEMIQKMEEVYEKWSYEDYERRKSE